MFLDRSSPIRGDAADIYTWYALNNHMPMRYSIPIGKRGPVKVVKLVSIINTEMMQNATPSRGAADARFL